MKKFENFEAKKSGGTKRIPAGGYVAKILDAKEVTNDWGSTVIISFDITEGEYKDFFRTDYANQEREDKKWRGVFRLREPLDDGSERDSWTKRTFGNAIWAIEKSNPGYHFDWDEKGFIGKSVGVLFRNKEWEMNGNTGWTTECAVLTSVEEIRNNTYKIPKDKPLSNRVSTGGNSIMNEVSSNIADDLPF